MNVTKKSFAIVHNVINLIVKLIRFYVYLTQWIEIIIGQHQRNDKSSNWKTLFLISTVFFSLLALIGNVVEKKWKKKTTKKYVGN